MPGAVAPARLVCTKCARDRTRADHRYNRTHAGIPCAMVVRLMTRSPRCPGFFSHRRPRDHRPQTWSQHRGIRTTRLCRPRYARFVFARRRVHRIPHQRPWRSRYAPLV